MQKTQERDVAEATDIVAQIQRALASTGRVVSAIDDRHWRTATLCRPWDVREELNHLVGGMRIFAAMLEGRSPEAEHESDWLGHDPQAAFGQAAALDAAAWQRDDALAGTLTLGFGRLPRPMAAAVHLTEVVVHGLDIAIAIDRPDLADEDLSAGLLDSMHAMGGLDPFRVPGMFGAQVPAAADSPPHRRLLAYTGRHLDV
ncbi:MAG: TIGR03086 family metal-binding protein [Candidatus Nanopelagicales bacterium]